MELILSSTMNHNAHSETNLSLRSSPPDCSVKKEFLNISQNLQENTCVRVSFLIKLQEQNTSNDCFYSFLQKIALSPLRLSSLEIPEFFATFFGPSHFDRFHQSNFLLVFSRSSRLQTFRLVKYLTPLGF